MAFQKQQMPPPAPGKQNQPPGIGQGGIGKAVPGKLKGRGLAQRTVHKQKPTKAPPPRNADGGSANEQNRLAKQVGDRLRQRDKRQFPREEE